MEQEIPYKEMIEAKAKRMLLKPAFLFAAIKATVEYLQRGGAVSVEDEKQFGQIYLQDLIQYMGLTANEAKETGEKDLESFRMSYGQRLVVEVMLGSCPHEIKETQKMISLGNQMMYN